MNSKPVNYKEAVEYIESIPKFTQKHTQEHTREFLERLGRPAFDRKVAIGLSVSGPQRRQPLRRRKPAYPAGYADRLAVGERAVYIG